MKKPAKPKPRKPCARCGTELHGRPCNWLPIYYAYALEPHFGWLGPYCGLCFRLVWVFENLQRQERARRLEWGQ